jgi:Fe2+ or Zn2+ uptake regulation protein
MPKASDPKTEAWLTQLHTNGYRLTGPRKVVVDILAASRRALNAAQIFNLARKRYPALGLVTVYRTLEKLEELHLVERVHQPRDCHAYLPATTGHQHLLLCRGCGQVEYFSGDDLEPLIRTISRTTGYTIQEHWLQLLGTCTTCQAKS